jgi:hypothetical protein
MTVHYKPLLDNSQMIVTEYTLTIKSSIQEANQTSELDQNI